jgi:peptidoglycan hydrolase-like protein with peptidoglycan-binding domain
VSVRTVLVGAVIVVVLILAGLAIGGVFSGGKQPAANPTTALGPTTQPRSTTPTTPARRVPTAPATTLKPGDQGVQVRRLQRVLARLGYSVGAADGVYGPATQAALTRFQKDHGLTADGVLGPRTLRALKLTLRTKS